MKHLVLGTAGHIDHGKTALVGALTGIDTDRLAEEKARGISIDLGFAEIPGRDDVRIGVVDVPGHEGFIRNMLAGATGMDLVLLVVAADEGVMPQTREHMAILHFLRVDRLVVAVTKRDLVDPEWLDLVVEDVRDFLAPTRFADAPIVPVSSTTGDGIEALREQVLALADDLDSGPAGDVVRLPVDRVFTIRGTGTVVTGTLWSGTVRDGDRVRLLPGGLEARVRGVQVHGADADAAFAGSRTALALTGDGIDTTSVQRGACAVTVGGWEASRMLTTVLDVLPDTGWRIEHGQRLRVHLGTAEVMARCVVLEGDAIDPGERGWVQLRLEAECCARAGDHLVVRSYSPVTTIAGGRVAEPFPPKRRRIDGDTRARLERLASTDADPLERADAALGLAGMSGTAETLLPVVAGIAGAEVDPVVADRVEQGALRASDGTVVGAASVAAAERSILDAVDEVHAEEAFLSGVDRARLRARIPADAPRGFADAILERLVAAGALEAVDGRVRRPGHVPTLTPEQGELRDRLVALFREGGLAPPLLDELDDEVRGDPAFVPILRGLEADGVLVQVDDGFLADAGAVRAAVERVRDALAGRDGLGPADFREALDVTRKHLMPLLGHFDRTGVTRRDGDTRSVPA